MKSFESITYMGFCTYSDEEIWFESENYSSGF